MLAFGFAGAASPQETAFREVSEAWGIDFRHNHGGTGQRFMMETVVGGVVLFDFDGDGDADVLLVDGGQLPGYEGDPPRTRLFRNDAGRFVDWTASSGIEFSGYGCGATAGDVDGDGDQDIYLTAFGQDALFVNQGDGTFVDRAQEFGLDHQAWSASAAFADSDLDGDLDLYVTGYVEYSLEDRAFCGNRETNVRGYCHPDVYAGAPDRFYENDGSGHFSDSTDAAGVAGPLAAGLGVLFGDLNGDLAPDLYVANDLDPNLLFLNLGDGTFEDASLLSGTAFGDRGKAEGGMGVELADFDGDGLPEIFVTNFALETNALYKNLGDGLFTDSRFSSKLGEPSHLLLGFGTHALDVDHDSDLDLLVANGHTLDNPVELGSQVPHYAMPNNLFLNDGRGVFVEAADSGLDAVRPSRGLAVADLDLDGDQDVVVVNSNDLVEVHENLWGAKRGRWLRVALLGRTSNRFGVGARLEASARQPGEVSQPVSRVSELKGSSSYLSRSELIAHFGLGAAPTVDLLVAWPAGGVQRFVGLPSDRNVRISEPESAPPGR